LGGVEAGTGRERGQEEFRWRHAFVEASVFRGLIAGYGVLASFDFELDCAEMIYCDFHNGPPLG
jgi:hypothetical protein